MWRNPLRPLGLLAALLLGRAASLRNRPPHDPFSVYDGQDLLQVTACDATAVADLRRRLARASCRILTEPGQLILRRDGSCAVVQATCPPQAALRGPGVQVLAEGAAGQAMRRRGALFLTQPMEVGADNVGLHRFNDSFYTAFRDYDDITARLRGLVGRSGGAAKLVELEPWSVEGRPLLAVRLNGPGWTPGAPRLVFTYTVHAREWISTMAGVYAVETTLANLEAHPEFYANLSLTFVPVSNPDGFIHSAVHDRYWRKNKATHLECEGVDLNRNFNFQWGRQYGPEDSSDEGYDCGEVFSGPSPASEPETRALQGLLEEAPLSVHLDFHSCGGFILGSWSFMTNDHPRSPDIRELGTLLQKAIREDQGSTYEFCTGNRCLYPVAGDLPDYATALGAVGFTVEMRPITAQATYDDFAPDTNQILPNAKENFAALQAAVNWAAARAKGAR